MSTGLAIGILCLTLTVVSILYLKAIIKIRDMNKIVIDLFFKNSVLSKSIDNTNIQSLDDLHKENFIKFLSDSREWAFSYIQEVQDGLTNFIKEVEPEISYYNKYGVVVEGMIPSHDIALKKISNEFEKLKKFLPEETSGR